MKAAAAAAKKKMPVMVEIVLYKNKTCENQEFRNFVQFCFCGPVTCLLALFIIIIYDLFHHNFFIQSMKQVPLLLMSGKA